jgi:hypothetical protein
MRIDLALLGDYALVDKMDKLTVAGIFRAVVGLSFPFSRPVMFLALGMTVEGGDDPRHCVVVRMIDPDGRQVIPELRADLGIERANQDSETSLNLILELAGVTFKGAGTHCFDVFVDGRFMERVPLEVMLAEIKDTGLAAGL